MHNNHEPQPIGSTSGVYRPPETAKLDYVPLPNGYEDEGNLVSLSGYYESGEVTASIENRDELGKAAIGSFLNQEK